MTQAQRRAMHRDHAREVMVRESLLIPKPPTPWNFGRRAEAWQIGYAAALEGLSLQVDDYYCRENFYRTMRSAFRQGMLAAQCHHPVRNAAKGGEK